MRTRTRMGTRRARRELARFGQPAESGQVKVGCGRSSGWSIRFATCQGSADSFDAYASVRDADSGRELRRARWASAAGQVWTSGFAPPSGSARAVFVDKGAVQVAGIASTPGSGVALVGYEYRRHQNGARPFMVALRMPGQYYDSETEAFDNWRREYLPSNGSYLEPEPSMQHSRSLSLYARAGGELNPYSYASSNPIIRVDDNGEFWWIPASMLLFAAADVMFQLSINGGDWNSLDWGQVAIMGVMGAFPGLAMKMNIRSRLL